MFKKIKNKIEQVKSELKKKEFVIKFDIKYFPVPGREQFVTESLSIDLGILNENVYQFCEKNDIEYRKMIEGLCGGFIIIYGNIEDRDKLYSYLLNNFHKYIELKPR